MTGFAIVLVLSAAMGLGVFGWAIG